MRNGNPPYAEETDPANVGQVRSVLQITLKIEKDLQRLSDDQTKRFNLVDEQFADLRSDMDARFEQVDQRFQQVDQRFDKMDQRLHKMDQRFDEVDERLDKMDRRFDKMDQRFDKVDRRLDGIDGRLASIIGLLGGEAPEAERGLPGGCSPTGGRLA